MKLIGLAVKHVAINDAAISDFVGTKFYNSLAPQSAQYPFAVGNVTSLEPIHSKANPNSGKALTDTYGYRITVFSYDAEEAARMAIAFREKFDRLRSGKYKDIQLNYSQLQNAFESGIQEDDVEIYIWVLDFQMRVDEINPC